MTLVFPIVHHPEKWKLSGKIDSNEMQEIHAMRGEQRNKSITARFIDTNNF